MQKYLKLGVKMDEKIINAFIDSTLHVLETMASMEVKAGQPYLKKDKIARGDVTGVIGLIGKTKGTLSISFSEKSILAIVSKMFREEMKELNEEIQDAVGEITNTISGQVRQKLDELGWSLKASIPTVITGKNHSITHITSDPIIAIPFATNDGKFTIEVCFEE
ncbi:chemotaxis protein CheX [Desulfobacula sp.]|uniref:chemotaxis protein CheX n=1 Tax=Desulfobacula sp. TaxID=2593537 RepID=UPI0039B8C668